MQRLTGQAVHDAYPGSVMRPRRWYGDEIAPQRRKNVKLNARSWHYRSLSRRKREDAAPMVGAACSFADQSAIVSRMPRRPNSA